MEPPQWGPEAKPLVWGFLPETGTLFAFRHESHKFAHIPKI